MVNLKHRLQIRFSFVASSPDSPTRRKQVKELQKATRIQQTLYSEAKGSKKTVITSKIPATKRSMERLLFHVKGLLHTSASGCSFWMVVHYPICHASSRISFYLGLC